MIVNHNEILHNCADNTFTIVNEHYEGQPASPSTWSRFTTSGRLRDLHIPYGVQVYHTYSIRTGKGVCQALRGHIVLPIREIAPDHFAPDFNAPAVYMDGDKIRLIYGWNEPERTHRGGLYHVPLRDKFSRLTYVEHSLRYRALNADHTFTVMVNTDFGCQAAHLSEACVARLAAKLAPIPPEHIVRGSAVMGFLDVTEARLSVVKHGLRQREITLDEIGANLPDGVALRQDLTLPLRADVRRVTLIDKDTVAVIVQGPDGYGVEDTRFKPEMTKEDLMYHDFLAVRMCADEASTEVCLEWLKTAGERTFTVMDALKAGLCLSGIRRFYHTAGPEMDVPCVDNLLELKFTPKDLSGMLLWARSKDTCNGWEGSLRDWVSHEMCREVREIYPPIDAYLSEGEEENLECADIDPSEGHIDP